MSLGKKIGYYRSDSALYHADLFNQLCQQFSLKINSLWNLDSEGRGNYFFAKWVLGVQFYNILVTY